MSAISSKDKPLGGNETQEPAQSLPSPLAGLDNNLSDSDLREAAYEIVVAACRSGTKPLTFISQTEKSDRASVSLSPSPSLQRSLTSSAASKLKKALGLRSKTMVRGDSIKAKRSATVGELMRHQMMISEQTDTRIRRALLRVTGGQLGRHMESYVLPLELIQQLKSSDFHNQEEYEAWVTRNLKFLKAGLLLHPHLPLGKEDSAARQLGDIIDGALQNDINIGKNRESMDTLRNTVMSLACRSIDGFDSRKCHWADGCPLNLRIYQTMLEACFDVDEETTIIEEVDEVIEILKRTWVLLGVNETLHNLMFAWILFQRYVATGQVESDLLVASSNILEKVEEEANSLKEPIYEKVLRSTSNLILGWAEKRLFAYHEFFGSGNHESMESVASLAVLSGKILVEDKDCENNQDPTQSRIHSYIRSSLHAAFSQKLEKVKNASENQSNALPLLCSLAQEVTELAFNEKDTFGPILKRWDPLAAGSAIAILHSCYRSELKQFLEGVSELTPDAVQVLLAADKLEKDLVQIAVETSVDSEDGGKSIIMEMPPYDIEAVINNLVKSWIKLRVDKLKEWIDKNLKLEAWSQHSNKECLAPSVVEVLRIVDEIFEAFFMLPVPMNPSLLSELITGLDKCLERYALKTKSGCGNRNTFIPTMHPLTRCSAGSKFPGVFKKKERQHVRRISLGGSMSGKRSIGSMSGKRSIGIPQLCVRINTLQHIQVELRVLEKRVFDKLKSSQFTDEEDKTSGVSTKKFDHSANTCAEAVQQLCEAIAYKIVFRELNHVFWDGLYVGYVSSSRIESFLQELDHYMEIISSTVDERIKMDVIVDIMKASLDGFLLVLLAGGPTRAFFLEDYDTIEEDFKFICDLFFANGEGVPMELVEKFSARVNSILPLFHTETEKLIEQYTEQLSLQDNESSSESSSKTHLPLPPTTGLWSPWEANTVLRVLCHRNDEVAAKFLKKTYNLPTKLHKEVSCMVYKWD